MQMAEGAVCYEPVSGEFPDKQGKNRKFFMKIRDRLGSGNQSVIGQVLSLNHVARPFSDKVPAASERNVFKQAISSASNS